MWDKYPSHSRFIDQYYWIERELRVPMVWDGWEDNEAKHTGF